MNRENYFILLKLPFDPPENNSTRIEAAIAAAQQQWSRDQDNPFKKTAAAKHLEMIQDIRKVMLDDGMRAKEAGDAKKIRDAKLTDLDSKLKLFLARGTELSKKDLQGLVKSFGSYGITENMISSRFSRLSKGSEDDKVGELIDKSTANNLKSKFQQLGQPTASLYDFLHLDQKSSCEQLRAAAEEIRKKMLSKGSNTAQDAAAQDLSGIAKEIFKDRESKTKYDNYLRVTRYHDLNAQIDEAARMNKRQIEPKMKDVLLEAALTISGGQMTLSQASAYIETYCSFMGYTLAENKVICGFCHTENPAGATVCSKCGKPLFIICPKCGEKIPDNTAKVCPKCGFDLTRIESLKKLVQQAKAAVVNKQFDQAADLVRQVKVDWANNPDLPEIEKQIQDFRGGFDQTAREISDAVAKKAFYRAKLLISKAENAGYRISDETQGKVDQTIAYVEKQLAAARSMDPNGAFTTLVKLSDMISDSQAVSDALKNFPPSPVPAVSAGLSGSSMSISWKKSSSVGRIEYVLVRKAHSAPNGLGDEQVFRGSTLQYTDSDIKEGVPYYYGVVVVRAGVPSGITLCPQAVVSVKPVSSLRAVGGDGIITLAWHTAPEVSSVKVALAEGQQQPMSPEAYRPLATSRLDGDTIRGLRNGARYWFRITALYSIEGRLYESPASFTSAVPVKPAKPLENFSLRYEGGSYHASFSESEWDVILFWSSDEPKYSVGAVYDLHELEKHFRRIDMNVKSRTEADFVLDITGEGYVLPGVISATNVIFSQPVYLSNVPPVSEVVYSFDASETELYVEFRWPEKIDHARVAYRTDTYPEGPEDPLARAVDTNKVQYDSNCGIVVSNPPEGMLYAEVYTYFEGSEKRIYSSGQKVLINNEPQRDVSVSFRYRKPGFFSKQSGLVLEIRSTGEFMLPQFVVESKFGGVPLKRGDGDVIASISQPTEVHGSYTYTFDDCPPLRKGTRLRLFFLSDAHYRKYKFVYDGTNRI